MTRKNQRRKGGCSRFLFIISLLMVLGTAAVGLYPYLDSRHRVVIDPGHGGYDVGAVGIAEEAVLTEETAEALLALLQADERFLVHLTRKKGEAASLSERCQAAVKFRADLFLSIHGNSAEDLSAAGFECYPAPPGRKHHAESLRFAGSVAARMEEAGAFLRGENGIRYAYYDEEGRKFFAESSSTKPRTESSFAVVDSSGCPAVLVEQCFVTNAADMDAFGDEDGCAAAAEAYYLAILDYFDEEIISE